MPLSIQTIRSFARKCPPVPPRANQFLNRNIQACMPCGISSRHGALMQSRWRPRIGTENRAGAIRSFNDRNDARPRPDGCADGGNSDPSSTHGKKPEEAKALELKGRPYPRHLARPPFRCCHPRRFRGHRNVEAVTGRLSLISAGGMAETDGYIGYIKPLISAWLFRPSHLPVVSRLRSRASRLPAAAAKTRALAG